MAQFKVIVNKLNKRTSPITNLNDKSNIVGVVGNGFTFESADEITNNLGTWYVDRDGHYYWGRGVSAIAGAAIAAAPVAPAPVQPGKATIPLPKVRPAELPVTQSQCLKVAQWMQLHFGDICEAAVQGTPFTKELLYAIACQESAIYFMKWINDHTPGEVLGRCVFDASGDANGDRSAFPKNTAAFIAKYGQQAANELIAEANKTRALRGWGPKQWVYAGYGIFQYDIQAIVTDEAFFTQKLWYGIDACVDRAMRELKTKWRAHPNDLFETVKAYNGRGQRAENYANNVMQFLDWIRKGV